MVTIAALLGTSVTQSGFATVPDPPTFLANNPDLAKALWSSGFMWTFFPTLYMTCYGMLWDSVVESLTQQQPYICMGTVAPPATASAATAGDSSTNDQERHRRQHQQDRAEKERQLGLKLDYASHNSWTSWWLAFRNHHFVLGTCMVLSLVWSVAGVPMTSFLFTDANVIFNTTEPVQLTKQFNGLAFSVETDMRQILEVVSAADIYGGSHPAWTTAEYAFPPFYPLNDNNDDDDSNNNMTIYTLGYSGLLDCHTYYTNLTVPLNETANRYDFPPIDDRNCPIAPDSLRAGSADSSYTLFVTTWATTSCGSGPASAEKNSRISLLAGSYPIPSASTTGHGRQLTNVTLISCIPSYWTTPGDLTVTFGLSSDDPNFIVVNNFQLAADDDASVSASSPASFETWQLFETALHLTTGFSPSDAVDAGLFGQLVYALYKRVVQQQQKQPPESNLELGLGADVLTYAMSRLFSSVFAVTAAHVLFQDRPSGAVALSEATRSTAKTRLVVVLQVAGAVLGILFVMLVIAVVLLVWYAEKPSILREEPVGLLGYDDVLKSDEVREIIKARERVV
ncbi:hypothetical protein B0H63DRAFT_315916 [Podospora didyma]|uniref:Uncharacterized protein n=1 Tax=Podospora didyma TaxID=330526 RepID=A0AAE0N4Y3_9PEZI|nr:hypothetical protein B0H63DRAFT_315916 [Podospora didyma]